MSKIKQMREFIARCPYMDTFTKDHINWTDETAGNYGIMPTGESTIRTAEDIYGNKVRYKQANFAIYARSFTLDDLMRVESAEFLESFTDWIDEQCDAGTFPHFGDEPEEESISAQNGMLFSMSQNGMTGLYQIQIQCNYVKYSKNERIDINGESY